MTIQLFEGDCLKVLPTLAKDSVDLVVTSPPYNVGMDYGKGQNDRLEQEDYLQFLREVMVELHRVLKVGGRICWNSPNQIRMKGNGALWSPSITFGGMLEGAGFKMFELLIWKQGYSDSGTAWGSWCSPSSPFIRHETEAILVYFKDVWKIQHRGESDLTPTEFTKWTASEVWEIQPERNRDHPAAFPEKLASRAIKMFSYVGDVVLDPFLGSGTTAVACAKLDRRCIGIEMMPEYIKKAEARILPWKEQTRLMPLVNNTKRTESESI